VGKINVLPQKTYLLEYFAGTYGDYISGLISYSVKGFYDDYDLKDQWRYWSVDYALVKRNRYSLSLRGGGYEYVEKYNEFMLSRMIEEFRPHFDEKNPIKVLFNTHPKLIHDSKDSEENYRTLVNDFTKTETIFLSVPLEFETIFKVACNEYYTSKMHTKNDMEEFVELFKLHADKQAFAQKIIPANKCFMLHDVDKIEPKDLVQFGDVDRERFLYYQDMYNIEKMELLNWYTQRLLKKTQYSNPEIIKEMENYINKLRYTNSLM
tara:strand:- start:344 stop:1138 length:795 start_codon:yes stop_codon:yes gene_type:complete